MLAGFLGKYKSIVISIALFLILDAGVLILNFYISFEISEDASGVNLAGRQRMLSQRMVKSILAIDYSIDDEVNRQKAIDELKLTVNLFDTTLRAFDSGGNITGADGKPVDLAKVTLDEGVQAIQKAKTIWNPYKVMLDELFLIDAETNKEEFDSRLSAVIVYASQNNLQLLKLMNTLTVALEGFASSKATRLRIIQTIGISLAVLNFFIIMFHFLKQLQESDERLEAARQETTEILDTVNEGLFLIDSDLNIGSQHSKKLSEMFGQSEVSNIQFEDLLKNTVNKKDLDTAERFIRLLYREDIKSELISDLNPLKNVQVSISSDSGVYTTKYFSFSFSRVYEGDKVKDILTTVRDVTEEVRLAKELELSKKQNDQQFEVLTEILHGNPETIALFLDNCFLSFTRINDLLRRPAKESSALRNKLQEISIEVHHLKGESGALSLSGFESLAHEFETHIANVNQIQDLSGDDFFPLIVEFEKLIRYTESMQSLSKKLASFASMDSEKQIVSSQEWSHLFDLVEVTSARCHKEVELRISGFSETPLTRELRDLINDVSIQCIRNSIVHGIETPEERKLAEKPPVGRIDIRLIQTSRGDLELNYKDDGAGFNYDAIRLKAISLGRWSDKEIESWDTKKLMSLIFQPGFSTADAITKDAGRGIGMDVIKSKVRSMQGKIKVGSRPGINTQIVISIPLMINNQVA